MVHSEGSRKPIRSVFTSDLADSDDVSVLSMAGASVIAYRAQLTPNQNVEIDATIHEDDAEHDIANEDGGLHRLSSENNQPDKSEKLSPTCRPSVATTPVNPQNTVDVIIADDHQLLDRHKKKKKKHKSKKHKKGHHKDFIDVVEYDMTLPVNEICFPSVGGPSTMGDCNDSLSRPPAKGSHSNPSVASTAESTGSTYQRRDSMYTLNSGNGAHNTFVIDTFHPRDQSEIPQLNSNGSSFKSHHSLNMPSSRYSEDSNSPAGSKRSSLRSSCSNDTCHDSVAKRSLISGHESTAHRSFISGQGSAFKSHVSHASISHITVDEIQHIRNELDLAKIEEMKVLELHDKLEAEILQLIEETDEVEKHKLFVVSELKSASQERENLEARLNELLDDNIIMRDKLQSIDEQEDEKRLDDLLDGMQAKMRVLRLKSVKKGNDHR